MIYNEMGIVVENIAATSSLSRAHAAHANVFSRAVGARRASAMVNHLLNAASTSSQQQSD